MVGHDDCGGADVVDPEESARLSQSDDRVGLLRDTVGIVAAEAVEGAVVVVVVVVHSHLLQMVAN